MLDLLVPPLFQDALIAGVAIAVVCSVLSVIVVLKRMAFIGQGISHAGFGGIGTAILLGVAAGRAQDALVLAFCVGTGVAIGVLARRGRIEADSAIGILLVGAMAWGVLMTDLSVVLQRYDWYAQWFALDARPAGFEQLLFGSLLSVTRADMWAAIIVAAAVVATLGALAKEMVFFTFDETVSRVFGVRTGVLYYLLLVLLSLTIMVSIRLVGFVLVSALLVIPGATALQLSARLGRVVLWSLAVGLVGVVGGLRLSLWAGELSSGPCIVGMLCVIFAVVFTARGWRRVGEVRAAGDGG
ncbi:MAG: metal ABC transporter permease [Phycisphaeraceae bacterium]